MTSFSLIEQSHGHFFVEGELTFFSLNKKNTRSFAFLKSLDDISIDLANVTSADSAGLALIIEWIKHSKQNNTKLTIKNIPHQLLTLAKLSGFEGKEYFSQDHDILASSDQG